MSVVVIATIRPLPGHREDVVAAFSQAVAAVHGEDGCELYALNEAADRLIMIEKRASQEALDRHAGGPNLAALGPKLAGAPEVVVARPVPAGDPAKGGV